MCFRPGAPDSRITSVSVWQRQQGRRQVPPLCEIKLDALFIDLGTDALGDFLYQSSLKQQVMSDVVPLIGHTPRIRSDQSRPPACDAAGTLEAFWMKRKTKSGGTAQISGEMAASIMFPDNNLAGVATLAKISP